jgi:hypothetical protein
MWEAFRKLELWLGLAVGAAGIVVVWFKPQVGLGIILIGAILIARSESMRDHWTFIPRVPRKKADDDSRR